MITLLYWMDIRNNSLVTRHWKLASSVSISIFLLYEFLMYLNLQYSQVVLCPRHFKSNYAYWIIYAQIAHLGCFFAIFIFVALKLTLLRPRRANISAYMVTLSIVSIAFTCNLLFISYEFGGICKDSFGYE